MGVSRIEVSYNRLQDCWDNVHKGGDTFFTFFYLFPFFEIQTITSSGFYSPTE